MDAVTNILTDSLRSILEGEGKTKVKAPPHMFPTAGILVFLLYVMLFHELFTNLWGPNTDTTKKATLGRLGCGLTQPLPRKRKRRQKSTTMQLCWYLVTTLAALVFMLIKMVFWACVKLGKYIFRKTKGITAKKTIPEMVFNHQADLVKEVPLSADSTVPVNQS